MDKHINFVRKWAANIKYIERIWFYGSRIKNEAGPNSDLDIAVELCQGYGLGDFMFEKRNWIEELAPNIPYKLDIKFYEEKEECICKKGVESASVLVYEKCSNQALQT